MPRGEVSDRLPPPSTGANRHAFKRTHPYAHETRLLFLKVLDQEWPELRRELVRQCQHSLSKAAPTGISYHDLYLSDRPELFELKVEFFQWAETAGRGIIDEWFLETALYTLQPYYIPPAKAEDRWLYPFEGTFPHRWPPPAPQVDATAPAKDIRRAAKEYGKRFSQRFDVTNNISAEHARWTVARLSSPTLSWGGIVGRFKLGYEESIQEVKRRVRVFARTIDLTLGETLGTMDKEPDISSDSEPLLKTPASN